MTCTYFYDYHPYYLPNKEINPNFTKIYSGKILDLKEGNKDAINLFYSSIDPHIKQNVLIAVVPSSDSNKIDTGIKELGRLLAENGRIDATSCLVRHTSVPKAANGGPRDVHTHINSIKVQNASLIQGKEVILLDDITTSGSSLEACKQLLLNAGASKVEKIAIAKTV